MASKIPEKLKSIAPFIIRGHQVDAHNPAIAYWCFYWAVQQILSNNLHVGDAEAAKFTSNLLDELERRKEKLSLNEAVTDDIVAQAYIEDFAQKVFQRADGPLQAGKATRQTADTFLAAATFLELCKVFDGNNLEVNQKIKYSKYNAARILKAIQAGEDPNVRPLITEKNMEASWPYQVQPSEAALLARAYNQPTVEDAPDESQLHQQTATETPAEVQPSHDVFHQTRGATSLNFPIVHPQSRPRSASFDQSQAAHLPQRSEDYFDSHPAAHPQSHSSRPATSHSEALVPHDLPRTYQQDTPPPRGPYIGISPALSASPSNDNLSPVELNTGHPPFNPLGGLSAHPLQHQNQSLKFTPAVYTPPPPPTLPLNTPDFYTHPRAADTPQYQQTPPLATSHYIPPAPHLQVAQPRPPDLLPMSSPNVIDSEAIATAQKYARWAISALDYDDYPTAVENLRKALQLLGAT